MIAPSARGVVSRVGVVLKVDERETCLFAVLGKSSNGELFRV